MAFAGVRAFCGTGCCDNGCEIGVDPFDGPEIGPLWEVVSGGWSQSAGVLHGGAQGTIIYEPHAGANDPIKIALSLTPTAGSPAIARVLVAVTDEDNYVFAELRVAESGCGWLWLGRRQAGIDLYEAEAVPLYENARELSQTINLQICWLPSTSGGTIQAKTAFDGAMPDEIGETSCMTTELGQQGVAWTTATVSTSLPSDGINSPAERASVIAARRLPWLRRALPRPAGESTRRSRAQLAGNYSMAPAGRGVTAAMSRRLPWLRRFLPWPDGAIGRTDREILAASGRSLATIPFGVRTGLAVIEGEWDFPSWRVDFHHNPPDHAGCPRCSVDCFLFEDCFGRDVAENLGCHWSVIDGEIPIVNVDGMQTPVVSDDGPAMALARHETTASENHQFVHLSYRGFTSVSFPLDVVQDYWLAEEQKVAILFGASADGSDYYRAEIWYTGNPGFGGPPFQWHCRLLHRDQVLKEVVQAPDYVVSTTGLNVCYENGYVVVSAETSIVGPGGGLVPYTAIGLRYFLGPLAGRQVGIAGDPNVGFLGFRSHQSPASDPDLHPLAACHLCRPYQPPCANCLNDDAPEVLMGTLAGATIGPYGTECGASGDINGNYLAFARGMSGDCCQWSGCLSSELFYPNESDCVTIFPQPGQVTVWGPQCRVNNHDFWTDNCFTNRTMVPLFLQREHVCARVYGMLGQVGINGHEIWATYRFVDAIWCEETAPDSDVSGNPLPNPDEVIERTGPVVLLVQQVIFKATLPDPVDCPNLDVTLTPVPNTTFHLADYCLFGGYPHIRNHLYDFTSATLRIRAAAL